MSTPLIKPNLCCPPTHCNDSGGSGSAGPQGPPGPQGDTGATGSTGASGKNAFTVTTANFTMPAEAANVTVAVSDTSWMIAGQILFVQFAGHFQVASIASGISVSMTNIEDTATGKYASNVPPGTVITSGAQASPAGLQGPTGSTGVSTLNAVSPTTTKGDIIVDNGANNPAASCVRSARGSDGSILCTDASQATGRIQSIIIPVTATDNGIPRFNGTAGLPVPLQASTFILTDNGYIQGTTGNARGTNATDLQGVRLANTQVASGEDSTISGGENNTASGDRSTISGGALNAATGGDSKIGGGTGHTASGEFSTVSGGNTSTASGGYSTVGGGTVNEASGENSTVSGGATNEASGDDATIGGGTNALASGENSTVGGGNGGVASGDFSTVSGGEGNTASADHASVPGGGNNLATAERSSVQGGYAGKAYLFGQSTRAVDLFSAQGDCQYSELQWRGATTGNTATELFLDGAADRAVVPIGKTWSFEGRCVVKKDDGTSDIIKFEGGIKNISGTTSLIGSVTIADVVNDGAAYTLAITASNGFDSLIMTVTGAAATNLRWNIFARLVEVAY